MGKGNNIVEKPNYVTDKKTGRVYINKTQYFTNILEEVFNFYLGGYMPIEKYLKDRKDMELGYSEVENVILTARAIGFTINQMKKIDSLTKNWI